MKLTRTGVFLLSFAILGTFNCNGQDELDDIFDDGDKAFSLLVGSDLLRFAGGTPNVRAGMNLMKDRIHVNGEVGAPLLGYRVNMGFHLFENQVKGGFEYNLSTMFRVYQMNIWGYASMYVGPEYEYWNYASENLDVADFQGFVNGVPSFSDEYGYSLDADYRFNFQRKVNRFGIVYGFLMELKKQRELDLFIHGGLSKRALRFNDDKSYGVNWNNEVPDGWVQNFFGVHGGYMRVSLTYRFKVI